MNVNCFEYFLISQVKNVIFDENISTKRNNAYISQVISHFSEILMINPESPIKGRDIKD